MRLRSALLTTASTLLLATVPCGPTFAGTADGAASGQVRGTTINVSSQIFGGRYSGQAAGGSSGGSACDWRQITEDTVRPGPYSEESYGGIEFLMPPFERDVDGVHETKWWSTCPNGGGWMGWVPQITAADLLPDLYDRMVSVLQSPQVQFRGLDPDFGWAYVHVPVGFRVGNTGPISVTARVTVGPLSVWATMTARPSEISFEPGEPGAQTVTCSSADAAQAGYSSDRPGSCSYTYVNSSAIAPNGRTFSTNTAMTYVISYESSSGPGSYPQVATASSAELAVAEVQALVTCTGPRPEQGGCG